MPYKIRKKGDDEYSVHSPSGVKSRKTSKRKAEAQIRLLNAIEHDPSFTPNRKSKKKSRR